MWPATAAATAEPRRTPMGLGHPEGIRAEKATITFVPWIEFRLPRVCVYNLHTMEISGSERGIRFLFRSCTHLGVVNAQTVLKDF